MIGEDVLGVGDVVELTADIRGRKELKAGRRGVVVVADGDASWGLVSVVLGTDPDRGRAWQIHRRHLALVARAPQEAAANG